MPTAESARQPTTHAPELTKPGHRRRHASLALIALLVAAAVSLPAQTWFAPVAAATGSATCSGWNSTTQPPDYIRVLRRQSGRVERVPFKKYVITVMGKEWPGYLPQAVIQAGSVAVKQYAWFHALGNGRVSRGGQCFDVTDGVGDQLYKPNRSRIRQDHYTAIEATWGIHLLKHGSLFMTGYRTGNKGSCGHDATGWKLYARSATRCADRGVGYQQILRIYYGPGVTVVSGGNGGGGAIAPQTSQPGTTRPDSTQPAADNSPATPSAGNSAPNAGPLEFVVPPQAIMIDQPLGTEVIHASDVGDPLSMLAFLSA